MLFVTTTVIVPVISVPVLLTGGVQFAIFPVPLAARPIAVLLFVQLTPTPLLGIVTKSPTLIADSAHTLIFGFWVIVGFTRTTTLKLTALPTQPFTVGVAVIVPA